MNILIVSGAFYPKNTPRAFRTTELAKQFCKMGHKVVIYIPKSDDDLSDFVSKYPIDIKNYMGAKSLINNSDLFSRIKQRLLRQFLEYPDIKIVDQLIKLLKLEHLTFDLLITIAVPHPIHWAVGLLYKRGIKLAKTWIADCGDPYMLCGTNQYSHPFYFRYIEKLWCNKCDYISVPTEASKAGYYSEFLHKIKVIPQGFDFSEIKLKKYVKNEVPVFAFSGNLIPKVRDPRPFLDYLVTLDIDFKFVLFATKHHLVEPYLKKIPNKIELHDYIPRLELIYYLSGVDFLVNIENVTTVQTPSKLIDYSLTGRPILSVNPNNINMTVIQEFLHGDYSHQYLVKNIDEYNIVNVANKFIELVNV